MALISRKDLIGRIRRGRKARAQLVDSNLAEGIAFQIRATRDAQNLTQAALADAVGMTQNNLSRLENPEYGKHTISSLKRIADALDVALVVRFVPFSQYIDWLSGTRHVEYGISPESLAVADFEAENSMGVFEQSSHGCGAERGSDEPDYQRTDSPRLRVDGMRTGTEPGLRIWTLPGH